MAEVPIDAVRPMKPAASLRERVEQAIAAAIVSGEMPPGQLYSAPTLAARFEVSATPVREAMLNLEKRGFVETVRNKGFRVTGVSERELREIVEVRCMLEPPALRDLASRFDGARTPALRGLADAIVDGARRGELGAYLAADTAFHLALLEMHGNTRLTRIAAELRSQTRLTGLAELVGTRELIESAEEHHALLDLLCAGDGAAAEALTARHIGHVLGWWAGRPER
ncbi:GntR family transcriptional regulator [Streptomyces sp. YIM S03343]